MGTSLAFTLKSKNGILNMLKTDVSIVSSVRGTNTDKKWRGLWCVYV